MEAQSEYLTKTDARKAFNAWFKEEIDKYSQWRAPLAPPELPEPSQSSSPVKASGGTESASGDAGTSSDAPARKITNRKLSKVDNDCKEGELEKLNEKLKKNGVNVTFTVETAQFRTIGGKTVAFPPLPNVFDGIHTAEDVTKLFAEHCAKYDEIFGTVWRNASKVLAKARAIEKAIWVEKNEFKGTVPEIYEKMLAAGAIKKNKPRNLAQPSAPVVTSNRYAQKIIGQSKKRKASEMAGGDDEAFLDDKL